MKGRGKRNYIFLFILVASLFILVQGYYFWTIKTQRLIISNSTESYTVSYLNWKEKVSLHDQFQEWGGFSAKGVYLWSDEAETGYVPHTIKNLVLIYTDKTQPDGKFSLQPNGATVFSYAFDITDSTGHLTLHVDKDAFIKLEKGTSERILNERVLRALFEITHKGKGDYLKLSKGEYMRVQAIPTTEISYFTFEWL